MNEKERRKKLIDLGLKQVEIAEEMSFRFGITLGSAKRIVSDMIGGRAWFPAYAAWLGAKYGIDIPRPAWAESARTRLKRAA